MKSRSFSLRIVLWSCIYVIGSGASAAATQPEPSQPSQGELERKLQAAQQRLDSAAREVAELSMSLSDGVMTHVMPMMADPHRAGLGLNISLRHGERDEGVEIISVSPGGPAAEAKLAAGDVLIEIDGEALKRERDRSPHEKLMTVMQGVEPGDKVRVRYLRGGKTHAAELVAQPFLRRSFTMPMVTREPFVGPGLLPRMAFKRAEGVFGNAEFVAVTPKLGQYFGTDKGLLVVRAPSDSRLKLEEGDVLLDIDGRTPSSPSHALSILSSYQGGEQLKLNVLRAKKKVAFEITIPENVHTGGRLLRSDCDARSMDPSATKEEAVSGSRLVRSAVALSRSTCEAMQG